MIYIATVCKSNQKFVSGRPEGDDQGGREGARVLKASELLQKALEVLDNGKKWCKGCFARTESGMFVEPENESAYTYCAMGAVCKASKAGLIGLTKGFFADSPLEYLITAAGGMPPSFTRSIAQFNDDPHTTFNDVKAVFEEAIELAKAEGN